MDVPMKVQCVQFLLAVAVGLFIGILYFFLRMLGRRGSAFLWDAVFAAVSLAAGTVFFMTVCRGYPRIFHLLGFALGAFGTHSLLGYAARLIRSGRSTNEKDKVSYHT